MNRRIILSLCLTISIPASVAILSAQEKPDSNASTMRTVVNDSMRDLWQCSIKPPVDKDNSDELVESLRLLESVRFPKKTKLFAGSKGSDEPSSQPTSQPDEMGQINPELLAKLKKLPPESIKAPAALAETLFLGGHLESAAFFYEMALKDETDADERAWFIFQTANCYRQSSPALAVKAYEKLMSEHPNSLWSSTADVPKRVIEWRDANNLDDLLAELRKRTQPVEISE